MPIAGYTEDELLAIIEHFVATEGSIFNDARDMYRAVDKYTRILAEVLVDELGQPLDIDCFDMLDEMWCEIAYGKFSIKLVYDQYLVPLGLQYSIGLDSDKYGELAEAIELAIERALASKRWREVETFGFKVYKERQVAEIFLRFLEDTFKELGLMYDMYGADYGVYYDKLKLIIDLFFKVEGVNVSVRIESGLVYKIVPSSIEIIESQL